MTEAILLSIVDFDSGRVTKRERETGAYLFRFSDEAGVLIRLFVMKFSIADEEGVWRVGNREWRIESYIFSPIPHFPLSIRQSMNGRSLSLRFIDA